MRLPSCWWPASERRLVVTPSSMSPSRGDHVDVVVERAARRARASGSNRPRSRRAAIAMPTALPTPWPSGPVVVSTPAVCPCSGWPGVSEPQVPQRLEVVELQAVAGQVELDVEGQAGVPADSTNRSRPSQSGSAGSCRMTRWNSRYASGRQAHRGARVAVADLLHGVHGQHPDGVDRPAVEVGPVAPGTLGGSARSRSLRRPERAPARRARRHRGPGTGCSELSLTRDASCCGRAGPCRPASSSGWSLRAAEPKLDHCERSPAPPGAAARDGRTVARSSSAGRLLQPGTYRSGRVRHGGAYSASRDAGAAGGSGSDRASPSAAGAGPHRRAGRAGRAPPAPAARCCARTCADQAAHRRAAAGHHAAGDDPGRRRAAAAGPGAGHAGRRLAGRGQRERAELLHRPRTSTR